MRIKTERLIGVLAAAMAAAGTMASAQSYTSTVIPNVTGGTGTVAFGVNDNGVVVGQADNAAALLVAFVFINGQTTELPLLTDGYDARAWSVNNSNLIVGECRNAAGVSRPVKWENTGSGWTITDLGTLATNDAGFGVATRVNNAGQIVGYATANNALGNPGAYHGCIWTGAAKTDVGTLGFVGNFAYSQLLGINENGEATGFAYATLQGPEHGMLVTDRGGVDITPPERFGLAQWANATETGLLGGYVTASFTSGAFRPATYDRNGSGGLGNGYTLMPLIAGLPEGYGYDINSTGQLVGTMFYLDANPDLNIFKGFVSDGIVTVDLTAESSGLPGVFTEARDISNTGLIVGTVAGDTGPVAVLLTPGQTCVADFNGDDTVSVQDIFDFLAAYFNSDPSADVNRDSSVTVQDIFDYLALYFAGCP